MTDQANVVEASQPSAQEPPTEPELASAERIVVEHPRFDTRPRLPFDPSKPIGWARNGYGYVANNPAIVSAGTTVFLFMVMVVMFVMWTSSLGRLETSLKEANQNLTATKTMETRLSDLTVQLNKDEQMISGLNKEIGFLKESISKLESHKAAETQPRPPVNRRETSLAMPWYSRLYGGFYRWSTTY